MKESDLARRLKPYVMRWVNDQVGQGLAGGNISEGGAGSAGGGSFAPTPHTHEGGDHSGTFSQPVLLTTAQSLFPNAREISSGSTVTHTDGGAGASITSEVNISASFSWSGCHLYSNPVRAGSSLVVGDTTSAAEGTLHIISNPVSPTTITAAGDDLVIETNNAGITLVTPGTSTAQILHGTPSVGGAYNGIYFFGDSHASSPDQVHIRVANGDRVHMTAANWEFQQEHTFDTSTGDFLLTAADEVILNPTNNLQLNSGGDVIFDPTGDDVYPASSYDLNLGLLNKKWLTLHAAELWVETLVAQETIATIGGRIIVAPTTTLTASVGAATTGSDAFVNVKHNQMTNGDIAIMSASGKLEFLQTTSNATTASKTGASGYEYSVTRDLDQSGVTEWYAGDALVNTGQAEGIGFIDLYSLHGIGERRFDYIQAWTGSSFDTSSGEGYAGSTDFPIFTAGCVAEQIWIGNDERQFNDVFFNVTTTGSPTTASVTWFYFLTGIYHPLNLSSSPDLTASGVQHLSFTSPSDWAQHNVNSTCGWWITGCVTIAFDDRTPRQGGGRHVVGGCGLGQFGPTIVGNIRNSASYQDWSEHWAIGNLNGLYGYSQDTPAIGLGKYQGSSWMTLDAASGIRMYRSSGAVVGSWEPGGDILLGEVATDNANILWEQSSGELQFRGGDSGSETFVKIDTDGSIKVLAGGTTPVASNAYSFIDGGGTVVSGLYGHLPAGVNNILIMEAGRIEGDSSTIIVRANSASGTILATTTLAATFDSGGADTQTATIELLSACTDYRIHYDVPGGIHRFRGPIWTGNLSGQNANSACGITINQGDADDEVLALKSSDVAHGATSATETDTFGTFGKVEGAAGGLSIQGFKDADGVNSQALSMSGILAEPAPTSKSTGAAGTIRMTGYEVSGTSTSALGANQNLFSIHNTTTTRFIFDSDGDFHADAAVNASAYDTQDDVALLRTLSMEISGSNTIKSEFDRFLQTKRSDLEKLGVLSPDEPDGAFVNWTQVWRLMMGGMWQMHERIGKLEQKLLENNIDLV